MSLINELLTLRNAVHKGKFRFNLNTSLWRSTYLLGKDPKKSNLIMIRENGVLRGYAVYAFLPSHQVKALAIQEICADGRPVFIKLVDKIIERSIEEHADFIYLRRCKEPFDDIFDTKGFLDFIEGAIMVSLVNLKELMLSLSEEIRSGEVMELVIEGFHPVRIKVGNEGIMVVKDEKTNFTVYTDSGTFLKLFLGKRSFLKELIKRKIRISNKLFLPTVHRFFKIIEIKNWYIPTGDWC